MHYLLMTYIFLLNFAWAQRVRHIEVQGDQIVTVRTSTGIATIIQVPDSPNSVVVGDQDSFKVEYLDQAITIKPLASGAKSNLYVYTEWRRFNIELVSGPQGLADYVVYLKAPKLNKILKPPIVWTRFKNSLKNDDLKLEIKRLGSVTDGPILIEFLITSAHKQSFRPEWLWLTQEGETTPIQNLIVSAQEVGPLKPISGLLQVKKSDLTGSLPLKLEFRNKKNSYLTLPRLDSWKL